MSNDANEGFKPTGKQAATMIAAASARPVAGLLGYAAMCGALRAIVYSGHPGAKAIETITDGIMLGLIPMSAVLARAEAGRSWRHFAREGSARVGEVRSALIDSSAYLGKVAAGLGLFAAGTAGQHGMDAIATMATSLPGLSQWSASAPQAGTLLSFAAIAAGLGVTMNAVMRSSVGMGDGPSPKLEKIVDAFSRKLGAKRSAAAGEPAAAVKSSAPQSRA